MNWNWDSVLLTRHPSAVLRASSWHSAAACERKRCAASLFLYNRPRSSPTATNRHPPALTPHLALQSQCHSTQPATNKNATSAGAVAQWLQRVRREPSFQTMNAGAVVKGRRGDDEFMNGFPAALMRLFQSTRKQLEAFSRAVIRFVFTKLYTLR